MARTTLASQQQTIDRLQRSLEDRVAHLDALEAEVAELRETHRSVVEQLKEDHADTIEWYRAVVEHAVGARKPIDPHKSIPVDESPFPTRARTL